MNFVCRYPKFRNTLENLCLNFRFPLLFLTSLVLIILVFSTCLSSANLRISDRGEGTSPIIMGCFYLFQVCSKKVNETHERILKVTSLSSAWNRQILRFSGTILKNESKWWWSQIGSGWWYVYIDVQNQEQPTSSSAFQHIVCKTAQYFYRTFKFSGCYTGCTASSKSNFATWSLNSW